MPLSKKSSRILIYILPALILIASALYLILHQKQSTSGNSAIVEDNRFLLDTVVSIKLYNSPDPGNLERGFELINDYELLLSRHRGGSDTARINESEPGTPVSVSSDTIDLITAALKYATLSRGRFDPTVGPLVDLWGIGGDNARVPDSEEIRRALPLVDYHELLVNPGENTVTLEKAGTVLELGGIAKGWIADRIADFLKASGESHVLINLGGNVLVAGGKPDGSPFKIGMQNPFADRGEYLGIFTLTDGSVVSSGIYERFLVSDGVRYHHILDTETGYPVNNGLAAVTVISDKSVDGDALSTTLFALGIDEGLKLVASMPGIEAAFITTDNRVVITSRAARHFEVTTPGLQMEIKD